MLIPIRLKKRMAGPEGNYAPGDEISVNERVAKVLVESDSAEYMETPKPEEKTKAKAETAMVKPAENAAMPKAVPRKVSSGAQTPKPRIIKSEEQKEKKSGE